MVEITDNEFVHLSEYIYKNYVINLKGKKRALLTGRLNGVLEKNGFQSFSEYCSYLERDRSGEAEKTLINQITTNYTYFMRESSHFAFIKDAVLPALEQSVNDRDLRIWSAGCSTGEEAYTLAFLLDGYFREKNWWDKTILATDISEKALGIAKRGIYETSRLTDLPPEWQRDYFSQVDSEHMEVKSNIRNQVVFAPLNLMGDRFAFRKKFHVILCRNVMIYFDQKTKTDLVNRFYDITAPGGYLLIGHTESIASWESKYKYIRPATYQKI
ncbi:MAG: CheR family methyltransferase [Clostridiaceae bacterium]|nr:CheR family methyltransferase [Clostridiaceae bacterium]